MERVAAFSPLETVMRTTKAVSKTAAVILFGVGLAMGSVQAQAASGIAMASVRILPPTRVAVVNQPTSINIGASDIKRGFVDSTAAQVVTRAGSTADGFAVSFESTGGSLKKVEVRRTNSSVATGSSQLFVGNTTTADVRFRFVLDSKVLPVSSQNATNLLVTYHAY